MNPVTNVVNQAGHMVSSASPASFGPVSFNSVNFNSAKQWEIGQNALLTGDSSIPWPLIVFVAGFGSVVVMCVICVICRHKNNHDDPTMIPLSQRNK